MSIVRLFVAPSLLLVSAAGSVAAQVRVGVHIDLPIRIGGVEVAVHRPAPPPRRYVVVYDYSSRDFGKWQKDARKWRPVTLFFFEGRYYEEPFRGARPVKLFHYRDRYFFEPRERGWYEYRDRHHDDWRWDDWNDRPDPSDRYDPRGDDRWDDRGDDRRARPRGGN